MPFSLLSPIPECQIVKIDAIWSLRAVAVKLIVDGDSVPRGGGRSIRGVQIALLAVERDRLIEQLVVRRALDLKHEMIPVVALREKTKACVIISEFSRSR